MIAAAKMSNKRRSYTVEQKFASLRRLWEEYGSKISLASQDLSMDQKRIREWRDGESSLVGATDKEQKRSVWFRAQD